MTTKTVNGGSQQRLVSFRCLRCGATATEAATPDLSPRTWRVDMSQCPKCERGDYYQESQYDAEGNELSIEEIAQFHTAWLREGEAAKANSVFSGRESDK